MDRQVAYRYRPEDIPPNAGDNLRAQIEALNTITRQLRVVTGTYFLFNELARRREFAKAIDRSSVVSGVRIVVGAITRDLVIGLASMFDPDQKAPNLRRIINCLLDQTNDAAIRSFHASWPVPYDTDAARLRLEYWQRRIKKGKPADAIQRVLDLRNKAVAHLDLEPNYKNGWPQVWEISYVLVAVAKIVLEANIYAVGKPDDVEGFRANCRRDATNFANALVAGKS